MLCFGGLSVYLLIYIQHFGMQNLKSVSNIRRKMDRCHCWILKKWNESFGTGFVWLRKGPGSCCCEYGNERLGVQIMQNIAWLAEEKLAFWAVVCLIKYFLQLLS